MDKYDRAIASLRAKEDFTRAVHDAWDGSRAHPDDPEGCLFAYMTPDGRERYTPEYKTCGCLTQIRECPYSAGYHAWTPELTERIRTDHRIPTDPKQITPDNLEVFAEYQRLADRTIRNQVPEGVTANG